MNKKVLVRVLVTILLLAFIFQSVDAAATLAILKETNIFYVFLVISFLLLNYIVSSIRWKSLLIFENTKEVSIPYLTKLYFIGSFFNNFMPTSIGGDVYKVFKLGKRIGSTTQAFAATFMERFTGILTLVLISYLGLIKTLEFWKGMLPISISQNQLFLYFAYFLIFFWFWVSFLFGFWLFSYLSKKSPKIKKLYEAFLTYKGTKKVLFVAFGTSCVVQLLAIFTQYFIFMALGYSLPVFQSLFMFPIITLASFFIPSLNGIGVQDFLYIQFLASVGITQEVALSGSLLYHLMRLLVSLIGGVLYAGGEND